MHVRAPQALSVEPQVNTLLRLMQRERRARDESDASLRQSEAAREEDKVPSTLTH